jgi:hypothetical protein
VHGLENCYSTDMNTEPVQYRIGGSSAASIVASVERGVRPAGCARGHRPLGPRPRPGARRLPHHGRERLPRPAPAGGAGHPRPLAHRGRAPSPGREPAGAGRPPGRVDLTSGNPDRTLLPDLAPVLPPSPSPSGSTARRRRRRAGRARPRRTSPTTGCRPTTSRSSAVASTASSGSSRSTSASGTASGSRIPATSARSTSPAPWVAPRPRARRRRGPTVEGLADALDGDLHALLVTPRMQNPTGGAIDAGRASCAADPRRAPGRARDRGRPRRACSPDRPPPPGRRPGAVGGGPLGRQGARPGPADRGARRRQDTVGRVLGRQRLGTGWVSHLLQRLTATIWMQARRRHPAAGPGHLRRAPRRPARCAAATTASTPTAGPDSTCGSRSPRRSRSCRGCGPGVGVQAGEPFRIVSHRRSA